MSDRVTYRRLVNLGEYEHLSLEVSQECSVSNADVVRDLVEHVDKWATLAKRKADLERELRMTELHFASLQAWAEGERQDAYAKDRHAKVEKLHHDLEEIGEEWSG